MHTPRLGYIFHRIENVQYEHMSDGPRLRETFNGVEHPRDLPLPPVLLLYQQLIHLNISVVWNGSYEYSICLGIVLSRVIMTPQRCGRGGDAHDAPNDDGTNPAHAHPHNRVTSSPETVALFAARGLICFSATGISKTFRFGNSSWQTNISMI